MTVDVAFYSFDAVVVVVVVVVHQHLELEHYCCCCNFWVVDDIAVVVGNCNHG